MKHTWGVVAALAVLALFGAVWLLWASRSQAANPAPPVAAAAAATPAATAAPPSSGDGQARISEAGSVTVQVTWSGKAAGLVFTVVMDTHSVDLDGYDLRRLAELRTDQGVVVQPTQWQAPKGGHHRKGTLIFPDKAPDGSEVLGPRTRSFKLTIRDIAGVPEREFRWDL